MCCKFLGPYRPWIHVNMSTLHVAVFSKQAVMGRYFLQQLLGVAVEAEFL
jgi:hypothetical protein